MSESIVLFACLLIILVISFLCPFFCNASFRWLSSVCSLSAMMKVLCTSELIDCFCAG